MKFQTLGIGIFYFTAVFFGLSYGEEEENKSSGNSRQKRILPVFQVVRFPNDPCTVTGGSKNGTCYTGEECSNKGGISAGSCAQGFGVCCTFTFNCGGSSSENCTYFDSSTSVTAGACKFEICPCSSNICQMRLDFSNFVISGPSTTTTSVGLMLAGQFNPGGKAVSDVTQCRTDTFSITNQQSVPQICGINSGYHVYFDADDDCHSLDFQLGNNAQGISTVATRSWSIKITQYSCDYENLAPSGCTQYHFGSSGTNYVQTFNFQSSGSGKHLADQTQVICVRRETGNCQICWSADAVGDVEVSGGTGAAKGVVKGTLCCNYGADGNKIVTASGGYDCIMIPGASLAGAIKPDKICGNNMGIITAAGVTSATLCSKAYPFRIIFNSDAYEAWVDGSADETGGGGNTGFKVRYFQQTC